MTTLEQEKTFRQLVQNALCEDHADKDVTTLFSVPETATAEAEIEFKQPGIICGLPLIPLIFEGSNVDISFCCKEGERCEKNTTVVRLHGNAREILAKERVMLNLVQLASSVATKTARYVSATEPHTCAIRDTRKTMPGLRALQKYAVKVGGGENHRMHLESSVLLKDNHLTHTTISQAVEKIRKEKPAIFIEVEVDTIEQLKEALTCPIDAILLDNMTPEMVQEAVEINGGKVYLEASGGITLDKVGSYAKTGVQGISIGALTHSIDALDISLNM